MIITNARYHREFGGGIYTIEASAEMEERGHEDDHRWGICIDYEEHRGKKLWSTHEYDAEQYDYVYYGHYFLENEAEAWNDYYQRCQEMVAYIKKWKDIKSKSLDR